MMIGKTFFNYKILKELGEGGMGTVYLAEHITLGTKSALKVLFPHLAQNEAMSERFMREAKAQAALKHPNIIRVIDYLESDAYKALVMEYIEGKPLSRVLEEKRGSLSYNEILHIIEGPLQALNYAHSRGIVHRDVKPSNIIINSDNKGYITDFGIAMILGMERKTLTGANLGTPHYMSPEQAMNPKNVDHRTDIYSIGCVLYEMATGIPPFDGDTDFQIIDKHINEIPKSITRINPDIPEYFASTIFKAMEKKPNERFSSCGEMLKALQEEGLHQYHARAQRIQEKSEIVEPVPEQRPKPTSSALPEKNPKWLFFALLGAIILFFSIVVIFSSGRKKNDSSVRSYSSGSASSYNSAELQSRQRAEQERQAAEEERKRQEEFERVRRDNESKYPDMAYIPTGSFEMGDHFNEGDADEQPVHTVYISEFWMDKYEVTNGEYKKCVDAGVCRAPSESKSNTRNSYYGDSQYENYPVVFVSWDDARKYCNWRGKRLPTEAEWEYSARGGLEGARYPWGNAIKGSDANYLDSGDSEDNETTAVGSYTANEYGLYDMAGNVWEWVRDWYDGEYYKNSPSRNPQGPSSGSSHVLRGGSWKWYDFEGRTSNRFNHYPTDRRSYDVGFRCSR